MVKKGQMIGQHRLDAFTSRPVAMAHTNEQGVTNEMRDHMYGFMSSYTDDQLYVGGTFNAGKRTSNSYTVALIPTVVRHGNISLWNYISICTTQKISSAMQVCNTYCQHCNSEIIID